MLRTGVPGLYFKVRYGFRRRIITKAITEDGRKYCIHPKVLFYPDVVGAGQPQEEAVLAVLAE